MEPIFPRTRRFPRAACQHSALVRLVGDRRAEEFARTQILGIGGCLLVAEDGLGSGARMELLIALGGRVVKTDARVVYERRRSDERHEIGVEFLRIAPADRDLIGWAVALAAGDG
jgi:c-di-GMP-binding flagellar brake protein YcgR